MAAAPEAGHPSLLWPVARVPDCPKAWRRVEAAGDPPAPRVSHTATLVGTKLHVVAGGRWDGAQWHSFGDVHVLDLQTCCWAALPVTGPALPPRRGHSAGLVDDRYLVVFGGTVSLWPYDNKGDLWALDTQEGVWSAVPTLGPAPRPRRGHGCAVQGGRYYLVFGGDVWDPERQDLVTERCVHVLDWRERTWRRVDCRGDVPKGLSLFSGVLYRGHWIVFGGYGAVDGSDSDSDSDDGIGHQQTVSNTLWACDLESFEWRVLPAADPPSRRYCHSTALFGPYLIVFGGSEDERTMHHDLHLLDLDPLLAASAATCNSACPPALGSWVALGADGDPPARRNGQTLVRCGNRLIVFGGGHLHPVTYYNDVFCLRLDLPLLVQPPPDPLPGQLGALLDNPTFADVRFEVGDPPRPLLGHRCLLAARSEFFAAMFRGPFAEAHSVVPAPDVSALALGPVAVVHIDDVPYEQFFGLLRYLYTGQLPSDDMPTALSLLDAANRFVLESLRALCEAALARHVTAASAVPLLEAACRYQCAALREVCLAYVAAHFPEVEGDVAALEPALQAEVRLRLDWA